MNTKHYIFKMPLELDYPSLTFIPMGEESMTGATMAARPLDDPSKVWNEKKIEELFYKSISRCYRDGLDVVFYKKDKDVKGRFFYFGDEKNLFVKVCLLEETNSVQFESFYYFLGDKEYIDNSKELTKKRFEHIK